MTFNRHGGNPHDVGGLYKEAADIGKARLDAQFTELQAMRQRTVQFLAFVGTATAFLMGIVLGGTPEGDAPPECVSWAIGAGSALAVLGLLALNRSILTGRRHWYGGKTMKWWGPQKADVYTEWLDKESLDEKTFYRSLAHQYVEYADSNQPYLERVRGRYVAFLTFGSVLLVAWGAVAWQLSEAL